MKKLAETTEAKKGTKMSKGFYKVILAVGIVFGLSQQLLISYYSAINSKLQVALGQCIGLKEGKRPRNESQPNHSKFISI